MLPGEGMASGLGWYGGIEFLKKWLTGPVLQVGWHQKGGGSASVAPSGGTKPSSQVGFYRAGGFQAGWVSRLPALKPFILNSLKATGRL